MFIFLEEENLKIQTRLIHQMIGYCLINILSFLDLSALTKFFDISWIQLKLGAMLFSKNLKIKIKIKRNH